MGRRRQDADVPAEEVSPGKLDPAFFATGHRMRTDEMHAFWQESLGQSDDRTLRASHISDDRSRFQSRRKLLHQVFKQPDWRAQDDQVGPIDRATEVRFTTMNGATGNRALDG